MELQNNINEQQRRAVVEKTLLHFYNQTLFEKGLINEKQYRKITTKINTRTGGTKKRRKKHGVHRKFGKYCACDK